MEVQLLRTKNGLVMVRSNHPEDWIEVGRYGAKDAQLITTANDPKKILRDLRNIEKRTQWGIRPDESTVSMSAAVRNACIEREGALHRALEGAPDGVMKDILTELEPIPLI